jgi:hypothetical protein
LFILLAAVYLVTGSGRFRIVDEVSLFGVTESVVKRGALDTNAIAWTQWVNSPGEVLGAFGPEGDVFSKKGPAPAFLAVPFYLIGWLSGRLPVAGLHLSMLQTALWLNAVVTALTAVLLARAALALGYSLRAALLAGAIFGLATIAWPYATHFFGEPISSLAILGLFYALLRLRQTGSSRYALRGGLAAGVMVATSAAHAILLVPFGIYLLYILMNQRISESANRRTGESAKGARRVAKSLVRAFAILLSFTLPLAIVAGLLAAYNLARFGTLFSTGYHFGSGEGFSANWLQGLWGLLFSPYRGIFWYTPLAIASVVAWPGFIRRHRAEGWLLAAVAVTLVGLFGRWWMWWGGFAWGPRFLVPLAPFLVLVLLPWLDAGKVPGARPVVRRALLAIIVAISFVVQVTAVTANYVNYETALRQIYPTDWADPLKYGPPALFNPAHSPVLGQVRLLLHDLNANFNPGWAWNGTVAWLAPALGIAVILLACLALWAALRRGRAAAAASVALALVGLLALAFVSARIYATRPAYGAEGRSYNAIWSEIESDENARRLSRKDGIVTVAPYHYLIPMARYRGRLPIYGYATEPTPLHPETEAVLWRALAQHPRIWLLTAGLAPADPANGVEAWLAREAFKADDRWFDDARKALFVTASRLEPLQVSARLGDQVHLLGARWSGDAVRPAGSLAVELTWSADAPVGDLRGFVQLLAADGRLVAQQDGVPGGGYAPSPEWQPGTAVADRRGLILPADLAPGEYTLIAGLYDAATGQRQPVAGPDGAVQGDSVSLGTVHVE